MIEFTEPENDRLTLGLYELLLASNMRDSPVTTPEVAIIALSVTKAQSVRLQTVEEAANVLKLMLPWVIAYQIEPDPNTDSAEQLDFLYPHKQDRDLSVKRLQRAIDLLEAKLAASS